MNLIPPTLIFVALLFLEINTAQAVGDKANGQQLAAQCVTCHGLGGNSTDQQYPRLAGQYADYLERALYNYRNGERRNAIMSVFASSLSDQEIADLAAWYASLPNGLGDFEGSQ